MAGAVAIARVFPLHTGLASVTAVRRVTPAMACLTLHAPAFQDPGIEQPGEILTLGWPADREPLVLPEVGWRFPAHALGQNWRNFTVRRADPEPSATGSTASRRTTWTSGVQPLRARKR